VAVLANNFLRPGDYDYFVANTRARVVVTGDSLAAAFENLPGLASRPIVLTVSPGRKGSWWAALDRETERAEPFASHPEDSAFWLYSSGTTGAPKAVVHRHRDIAFSVDAYCRHVLQPEESDVFYATSKLFFAYGLGASLYFPLSAGTPIVLSPEPFDAGRVWRLLLEERPSVLFSVPSAYRALLHHPHAPNREEVNFLRRCISAGEGLPPSLFESWRERFGCEILDGIGSTEMLHIYLSNLPGRCAPGSLGWPVPGYEAKVVDEEGRAVPPGTPGVMLVRGGSLAAGYWHRGEATSRAFQGEWYVTGDQAVCDADGSYRVLGRADDMLKVAGQWVAPGEIEELILQVDGVRDCAVVGAKRADGFLELVTFVVSLSPHVRPVAERVERHCAEKLPRYKRPSRIETIETLPRTATGKIQRFRLREQADRLDEPTRRNRE